MEGEVIGMSSGKEQTTRQAQAVAASCGSACVEGHYELQLQIPMGNVRGETGGHKDMRA